MQTLNPKAGFKAPAVLVIQTVQTINYAREANKTRVERRKRINFRRQ